MARPILMVAFAWVCTVSAYLAFAPTYASVSSLVTVGTGAGAPPTRTMEAQSLWQLQGPGVLVALGVPVLLVLAPLLVTRRWRSIASGAATVLLGIIILLTAASVGLFYAPAALLLLLAALLPEPTQS